MHYESNGISLNVNIGELEASSILKNRVVLITGGTSGIGLSISKECIKQGAKIIVVDRNQEKLEKTQSQLGENCSTILFDLTEYSRYRFLLDRAHDYYGNVDSIVHSAGISLHEGDFMNVTEETWDKQFSINLKAPYFLTQEWLRYYSDHNLKNGKIIMMASDTSGMGSSIPYGLSKVGIASLTHGLAKKLITKGIRINAIAPGTTLTPMTDDFTHGEVCRPTTEGKRVLFPEEIAEVCLFLLSDMSNCISGNVFGCSEGNICFDNVNREQETNP